MEALEEEIAQDPFFRAFEEALAENPDADPDAIATLLELAYPFEDPDPDEPMPRSAFVAPAVTIRRRSCGRACGHRSSGNGTGNGKGGGDGGDSSDGDGDSDEDSQNAPLTKPKALRPVWVFVGFCGFLWRCKLNFCQGQASGCYNKSGEPTPKGLSTPPLIKRGDAKCCHYP